MSRRRLAVAATAAAVATVAASSSIPAAAQPQVDTRASVPVAADGGSPFTGDELGAARERKGNLDLRSSETSANPDAATGAGVSARTQRRVDTLRALVGPDVRLIVDPVTATPSHLARLDGYLTGASSAPPARVVRSYLRANARALGLSRPDLATLRMRSGYTDTSGISHVSFEQRSRGLRVFGNGVRGHVDAHGRLISLQGAPVPGLAAATGSQPTAPTLPATSARSVAAEDVGGGIDQDATLRSGQGAGSATWSNGDRADLVWFVTQDGARLAWSTYTQAGGTLTYSHVIDGADHSVLYRRDLVDFAEGEARVYDYYPGAARGGEPQVVSLTDRGWLPADADWLDGRHVSAWADLDADGVPGAGETTRLPERASDALATLMSFDDNDLCSASFVCTWDPEQPFSWEVNQQADVANAFYLTQTFREWLERPGIGFTPESGAFDRRGGDLLLLQTLVGADLDNGFPDAEHVDTASMTTPPDGIPATMRTHLWHEPGQPNSINPYAPTSGSFDASIVFHEYAHGLANRLVVDPFGSSTLSSFQASALGEALGDYYAMDNLVSRGLQRDAPGRDGQVQLGRYAMAGRASLRTMAIDCTVGTPAPVRCRSPLRGHVGGYTYGDLSDIGSMPSVHGAGEVFSQTLWDIREQLGPAPTRRLVTTALRLVAPNPSILDLRDAILQADQVRNDGAGRELLWRVFAERGMGWYAGTTSGHDLEPTESFRARPVHEHRRPATGRVTDGATGLGIEGARVVISGHGDAYSATTDASGTYRLHGVVAGRYEDVRISAPGYDEAGIDLDVSGRRTTLDAELRRNWAADATVLDATGRDLSDAGCGPGAAFDSSSATGWSSSTGDDEAEEATAVPVPKLVDIELREPIDIVAGDGQGTAFGVDPSHTCGNPGSTSTDGYRIDVSTDAEQWTTVADGSFGTTRGRLVPVEAQESVTDVRFVRFWMRSPQVPDLAVQCPEGPYAGCRFMDVTEVQVFGPPS
ncbi:MAG: M36 family metallopeptidase [Actinomycetota bacterium]|nr:M36 family metallopeptidase [Actinomycetota bacterium]